MREADLRSWVAPGAQDAAKRTYASVQVALARSGVLKEYDCEVFLQGSYANSTNIRGDSDVDIVVMARKVFYPDTTRLSPTEVARYEANRHPATARPRHLRDAVQDALVSYYGSQRVSAKNKCIRVAKTDGYVDADVVPSLQKRTYLDYPAVGDPRFIEGITITPLKGPQVTNYPKEHKRNGTAKNQATGHYKDTVRQLKRLRSELIHQGNIARDDVSGYLLECMTYNCPDYLLTESDHVERLRLALYWLGKHSPEQLAANFVSCDKVHHLFRDDPGLHNQYTAARVIAQMYSEVLSASL